MAVIATRNTDLTWQKLFWGVALGLVVVVAIAFFSTRTAVAPEVEGGSRYENAAPAFGPIVPAPVQPADPSPQRDFPSTPDTVP